MSFSFHKNRNSSVTSKSAVKTIIICVLYLCNLTNRYKSSLSLAGDVKPAKITVIYGMNFLSLPDRPPPFATQLIYPSSNNSLFFHSKSQLQSVVLTSGGTSCNVWFLGNYFFYTHIYSAVFFYFFFSFFFQFVTASLV